MKVLVECEESQAVCIAFRERGHEAYSCDLLPCSGGHPEWHIKMDVFELIKSFRFYTQDNIPHFVDTWDIIISHQPCTDLAVSGARWFEEKRNNGSQEKSIRFFFEVWKHSNCSENPIGILNGGEYVKRWFHELYQEMKDYGFPFAPSQIIQPYYFGNKARKTTCLWLKGLPPLKPTSIVEPDIYTCKNGKTFSRDYMVALSAGKNRGHLRSKTYSGIAKAMAEQWG